MIDKQVAEQKKSELFIVKLNGLKTLSESVLVVKAVANLESTSSQLVNALGRVRKDLVGLLSNAPPEFLSANMTAIGSVSTKLDQGCDILDKGLLSSLNSELGQGLLDLVEARKKPKEANEVVRCFKDSVNKLVDQFSADEFLDDFKKISSVQRAAERKASVAKLIDGLKVIATPMPPIPALSRSLS